MVVNFVGPDPSCECEILYAALALQLATRRRWRVYPTTDFLFKFFASLLTNRRGKMSDFICQVVPSIECGFVAAT